MEKECALLMLLIMNFSSKINSKIYPSIQWNPRNPIFKMNFTLAVLPASKLTIVCPNKATILTSVQNSIPEEELYENIWLVDKGSYDSCTVNTNGKKKEPLGRCNKPLGLIYFPLVFQPVSSTNEGLEFTPGGDYFFIATSDGTRPTLNNTSGGHCKTVNMRMKIYICRDESDPRCDDTKTTPAPTVTTTHPTSPNITSTKQASTPDLTTTRTPVQTPSPKIITCQPPVTTPLPTVTTASNNEGKTSSQHGNNTLQTTPGGQPVTDFSKRLQPCDELKYQVLIALLIALLVFLLLSIIYMYLNFYHNLTFRWTKQKKIPSVTFSTKRIPKVTQESCPGCIFENKNTEQETSLK